MSGLKLYTGNRLEALSGLLAEIVKEPLESPFAQENIMVQSMGMIKWLSLRLSEKLGIWANCRYILPNVLIEEIFNMVYPGAGEVRYLDVELTTWKIFRLLDELKGESHFERICRYLSDDTMSIKRFQLSSRIAGLFDQYLTFRPEMILNWDKGKTVTGDCDEKWQLILWQKLSASADTLHPPAVKDELVKIIKNNPRKIREGLPPRISVFGISYLPPFHMEIIMMISQLIDINFFLLSPTDQYWAHIASEREIAKRLRKIDAGEIGPAELHLDKGNTLLSSLGKPGRDFFDLISQWDIEIEGCFNDPGNSAILQIVQSDILNLYDRGEADKEDMLNDDKYKKISVDNSIVIHSCHSAVREVEVLYDYLIDLFNSDPDLKPKDIIVMTPDLTSYSPYIEAVFKMHETENMRIPFSIADMDIRKESKIIDLFFAVINLAESRYRAGDVMEILESEYVYKKFGLTGPDIEVIFSWIRDLKICWAFDGEHKRELGLPEVEENSWMWGIKRLLLGYAMPPEQGLLYENILPFNNIEGTEASILGKFTHFIISLKEVTDSLKGEFSLKTWKKKLTGILDKLLDYQNSIKDINKLLAAINRLDTIERETGSGNRVNLTLIRIHIEKNISREKERGSFITGGVTFCSTLPMRSIPFKIICLIGMNGNTFPRKVFESGFDLIAKYPARGDRSLRDEDRYLFLEAVISAREKLYISFTGQSIQDNSEIPPAEPVSELMDYIVKAFGNEAGDSVFIKQRLQPFNREYFFNRKDLFSYSRVNFDAASALAKRSNNKRMFIHGPIKSESEKAGSVNIKDLMNFFSNPARYLLLKVLGINLEPESDLIDSVEPFKPEGLDAYILKNLLAEDYLKGMEINRIYESLRAKGLLPHGNPGYFEFDRIAGEVLALADRVKKRLAGAVLDPLYIDIDICGVNLHGTIDNIRHEQLVRYRFGKCRAVDRLKIWIEHLLLNSVEDNNYPRRSLLICEDQSWEAEGAENGRECLEKLVSCYLKGIGEPVPFLPESSFEYAQNIDKKKSHEEAIEEAYVKMTGTEYNRGELANAYFFRCFGDGGGFREAPGDKEFASLALEIYKPVIEFQDGLKYDTF